MSGTDPRLQLPQEDVVEVDPMADALKRIGLSDEPAPKKQEPVYKMRGDTRIPVSKARGSTWRQRRDVCLKSMESVKDAWQEAMSYYNQDQAAHREGGAGITAGNRYQARKINDKISASENIVFSNIRAKVPELYAKNPMISATAQPMREASGALTGAQVTAPASNETLPERRARAVEKLVNVLFTMKAKPGVNLKPKVKKGITTTLLTNRVWFECGYTNKTESSEQAFKDLQDASKRLEEAKTKQEIEEAEGILLALEEKIEFVTPGGPWVAVRDPRDVLVDPNSVDPWLSDANWVMIAGMLPTSYIKAVFATKNKDEDKSIYEPTHILDGDSQSDQERMSLFKNETDFEKAGYGDQASYDRAKRTKVWYVWDRVTRRVELYNDKNWSWPLWVWDDPTQLVGFFPITPLYFYESPDNCFTKGETSYVLDQQDMINEIVDNQRRALSWTRRNTFFNQNKIKKEDAQKVLLGAGDTCEGVDVPEGAKLSDLIFTIPPPSAQFAELFDKSGLLAAVDRIYATNEGVRGGQFKTNTTNGAIDYYATMGNTRNDEKLDAIEDCIGEVGWKIAQLCMNNMPAEEVQQLTNLDVSEFWGPMDQKTDLGTMSITCVGGSTQKSTAQQKKKNALEMAQVLSQFVKAAPSASLKVVLKMFGEAFDDINITAEDWEAIDAEIQMQAGGGEAAGPGGMPATVSSGGNPKEIMIKFAQMLQQMPPEAVAAIGQALASGIPPMEIVKRVLQGQQAQPVAAPQEGATQP